MSGSRREGQHEYGRTRLQGVEGQHGGYGKGSEKCQGIHAGYCGPIIT